MPKPLISKLDPMDVTNKHLYMLEVDASEDATLKPRQKRIIVSSRPLWYADEDDNYLKPIATTLDATEASETRTVGVGTTKNTLNFMSLDNGDVVYYLRGHKLRLSPSQWPGQTERGQVIASRVSKTGAIAVEYEVLPGRVKETIVVSDKKITSVAWNWASNLVPTIVNDSVSWRFGNREIFHFTPLSAWDSDGAKLKCYYQVTSGRVIVSFDEDEIKSAVYPITIDPTVTTEQSDAVYNVSLGEDDWGDDGYQYFHTFFCQANLPDLTGFGTIDSAVFGTTPYAINGIVTAAAYCDIVNTWTESSTPAALVALVFNAVITTGIGSWVIDTTKEIDILGAAGVNGIAKIYADAANPDNCTVKLVMTNSASSVNSTTHPSITLGDGYQLTPQLTCYSKLDNTYYWYIAITYTGDVTHEATIDATLPQLVADIAAVLTHPATIDSTLPQLTAGIAAKVTHVATIAAELPQLTAKIYIEPLVAPRDEESGAARIGEYRRLGMEFGRI